MENHFLQLPLNCFCEKFKLIHLPKSIINIIQNYSKITQFGKTQSKSRMFGISGNARCQRVEFHMTMPGECKLGETWIFPPSTHKIQKWISDSNGLFLCFSLKNIESNYTAHHLETFFNSFCCKEWKRLNSNFASSNSFWFMKENAKLLTSALLAISWIQISAV